MRRVTMFVGSLTAVLALGAAVAFAAGPLATVASQTESEAAGSGFFVVDDTTENAGDEKPVEEPVEEKPDEAPVDEVKDEKPEEEPAEDKPKDDEPADEEPKEEEPKDEEKPADEADTTPPEIEILFPTDGQVFETDRVAFEGKAEPGARVFAGDWEADVSDDGAWRIVLVLQPGSNVATITAIDEAGNEGKDRVQVFFETGKEDPPAEPPKEDPPKDDKPPHEDEKEKDFTAHQLYGSCGEEVPYDVFYGTGTPGTTVSVTSAYGNGSTTVNEHGEWELTVEFPNAPLGEKFVVTVTSSEGHAKEFKFKATGEDH